MKFRENTLVVGRIGKPFGIKGWVKIHSFTDPEERLFEYAPWLIEGKIQKITDWKAQEAGWVALLEGVADRDEAATLTNADISIPVTQLAPLPPGQYYWAQLLGLAVINQQGYPLGNIDRFLNTGATDIAVVLGKTEYWIPLIKGKFTVDLNANTITVDWHQDDVANGRPNSTANHDNEL